MNPLTLVAVMTAIYFCMLFHRRATTGRQDKKNLWTLPVIASLAWWNVCDAFFSVAQTERLAWFWHRMGALGWCGFIAVTAYYFLVMTGADEKLSRPAKALYWAVPLALTVRFMAAAPSALAEQLIPSGSGLGWTYVQTFHTVWPFLYLGYLVVYLGGALLQLYQWQRSCKRASSRTLAKGFVALDTTVVVLGFLTVYVVPHFTSYLPPMPCLATLIFGIWYWGWLKDYDFMYLELAMNPGFILDSCIDAMLVTDEEFHILYANEEARQLLGEGLSEECTYLEFLAPGSQPPVEEFMASDRDKVSPLDLQLKNGVPIICSISRIQARRKLKVCVVCMNEISQLKRTQAELDYLAHYDMLTGLVNRRRLTELLQEWQANYETTGADFELLFFDLTAFKQVNDTYGHSAGDLALRATAEALRAAAGEGDVLARYAGDEFVALHPMADGPSRSERFRDAVRAADCSAFAEGLCLDVDVGEARFSQAGSLDALFRQADAKMYEQKRTRAE